jgi:hypothetical protein
MVVAEDALEFWQHPFRIHRFGATLGMGVKQGQPVS